MAGRLISCTDSKMNSCPQKSTFTPLAIFASNFTSHPREDQISQTFLDYFIRLRIKLVIFQLNKVLYQNRFSVHNLTGNRCIVQNVMFKILVIISTAQSKVLTSCRSYGCHGQPFSNPVFQLFTLSRSFVFLGRFFKLVKGKVKIEFNNQCFDAHCVWQQRRFCLARLRQKCTINSIISVRTP